MKRLLLLALLLHPDLKVYAQAITPGKMETTTMGIKDRLVTLALQNPDLEVSDHAINIAKYQLQSSKAWLANNISVSLNANEFTIKRLQGKTESNGQYYPFYPFYNIGINIPLGNFFSKSKETRIAREQVKIAQENRETKYREIKTAVLLEYETYLANQELLTVQSQITENTYNDYLQAKEQFRNGQIKIDEYNAATKMYHDQLISKINAQQNFDMSKIKLESLIGVPLNNVLESGNTGNSANASDSTLTGPKN